MSQAPMSHPRPSHAKPASIIAISSAESPGRLFMPRHADVTKTSPSPASAEIAAQDRPAVRLRYMIISVTSALLSMGMYLGWRGWKG